MVKKIKYKPTADNIAQYQGRALARLNLWFTGYTHGLLIDLLDKVLAKLTTHANEEGIIPVNARGQVLELAAIAWREAFTLYEMKFQEMRRQAALISFAALPVLHKHMMDGLDESRFREQAPNEIIIRSAPFYDPQIQEILDVTADRVYSDGFKLSERIWRMDQDSLADIQRIIRETLANGDSAWNAAKRLEGLLGAGQECPRWTSTRLSKLTKQDIASGDRTGLISGPHPCVSKGVAYNALRLARNEIQIAHAAATDVLFKRMPFVEYEKVNLSPAHPAIECQCPDVANGGENGDGVYPVGTIKLPLHVQCMCFKTAVLMPPDQFVSKLGGWMRGESAWSEMDDYANWCGVAKDTIAGAAIGLDAMETLSYWMTVVFNTD